MINESVLLCGVVKNCERSIQKNIDFCLQTCFLFKKSKIIIYENNSTDGTKAILNQYKSNDQFKIISEDIPYETIKNTSKIWTYKEITGSDHPCRIEQISNARNKVIEEFNKKEYDEYHYVIFIDLDSNGWRISAFEECFKRKDQWDVLYANGISSYGIYYDDYAYRNQNVYGPELLGEHFWNSIQKLKFNCNNPDLFIPVYSAFGGIGIYKKEIFKTHRYDCIVNDDVKKFIRDHFNETSNELLSIMKEKCSKFPKGVQDEIIPVFWKSNSGYDQPVVCEHVCLNYSFMNDNIRISIYPYMIYFHLVSVF